MNKIYSLVFLGLLASVNMTFASDEEDVFGDESCSQPSGVRRSRVSASSTGSMSIDDREKFERELKQLIKPGDITIMRPTGNSLSLLLSMLYAADETEQDMTGGLNDCETLKDQESLIDNTIRYFVCLLRPQSAKRFIASASEDLLSQPSEDLSYRSSNSNGSRKESAERNLVASDDVDEAGPVTLIDLIKQGSNRNEVGQKLSRLSVMFDTAKTIKSTLSQSLTNLQTLQDQNEYLADVITSFSESLTKPDQTTGDA